MPAVTFGGLPVQSYGDTAALQLIGFDPSKLPGQQDRRVPVGMLSSSAIVYHMNNFPQLAGELNDDGRLQRAFSTVQNAISTTGATGGKVLVGVAGLWLNNPPPLPDGVSLEGDGGHVVTRSALTNLQQRPYMVRLTPGAALGGTANPGRYAGALTLGNGCELRGLSIVSAAALVIVGTGLTNVIDAQRLYVLMRDSGGNGVESLGHDPLFEDIDVLGFQTTIWHGPSSASGMSAGDRPVFRNVHTHGWVGLYENYVHDQAPIQIHHYPYLIGPNGALPTGNAWGVTIASDGASGSDITVLTSGPNAGPAFGTPVDGTQITICLQHASSVPAPSSANAGLNRFGDPGLANAVWRNRSGTWVINLPTCPPSSFASAPTTLSFVACGGTGVGVWLDSAGSPQVFGESVGAQTAALINNSPLVNLAGFVRDGNGPSADMTQRGLRATGTSYGITDSARYSNGAYYSVELNLTPVAAGGTQPPYRAVGMSCAAIPAGGGPFNILSGEAVAIGCYLGGQNINVDPTNGSLIISGASKFLSTTPHFMVNGGMTQPANLVITAECINIPSWITPAGAYGLSPSQLAILNSALAKTGDASTTSFAATTVDPLTASNVVQAFNTDWMARTWGPNLPLDAFENNAALGTTDMFLTANTLADAKRTGRYSGSATLPNCAGVINAAVSYTAVRGTWLVWNAADYDPQGQILLPDPVGGIPLNVRWKGQRGHRLFLSVGLGNNTNGLIQNNTKRDPNYPVKFHAVGMRTYTRDTTAVDDRTGLVISDRDALDAVSGGDWTGLLNPANGTAATPTNYCSWQTSATQIAPVNGTILYFDTAPPAGVVWTGTPLGIFLNRYVNQGSTNNGAPVQVTIAANGTIAPTGANAAGGAGTWTGWQLNLTAPNLSLIPHNVGIGQNNAVVRTVPGATPYVPPVLPSSASPGDGEILATVAPSIIIFSGNNVLGQGPTPVYYQGSHYALTLVNSILEDCTCYGVYQGQGFMLGGNDNLLDRVKTRAFDGRQDTGSNMWIFGKRNRIVNFSFRSGDDACQIVNSADLDSNFNWRPGGNHDVTDTWFVDGDAYSRDGRWFVSTLTVNNANQGYGVFTTASSAAPVMSDNSATLYFDAGTFTTAQTTALLASAAAATAGTTTGKKIIYCYKKFYIPSGFAYVSAYADNVTIGSWTGTVITLSEVGQTSPIRGHLAPIPTNARVTFVTGLPLTDVTFSIRRCGAINVRGSSANHALLNVSNYDSYGINETSIINCTTDGSRSAWTNTVGANIQGGPAGGVIVRLINNVFKGYQVQALFMNGSVLDYKIEGNTFYPPSTSSGQANVVLSGASAGTFRGNTVWATAYDSALQIGFNTGPYGDVFDPFGRTVVQSISNVNTDGNFFMGCQDTQPAVIVTRASEWTLHGNTYQQATFLGTGSAYAISYDNTCSGGDINWERMTGLDGVSPIMATSVTAVNATVGFDNRQNPTPNGTFTALTITPSAALVSYVATH